MRTTTPSLPPFLATGIVLCAAASAVSAQTPQIAIQEGQFVYGSGNIRFIQKLTVINNGLHFTEVVTDNNNRDEDSAILRNGFLSIPESTPVARPGGTIQRWDDLHANNHGQLGWPLKLQDTPNGRADDEGLYWNTVALVVEGDEVEDPSTPGWTYTSFNATKINDANDLLAVCGVDSGSGPESILLFADADDRGNLLEQRVLLRSGEPVPGGRTGELIEVITGSSDSLGFTDDGRWMAQIRTSEPAPENTVILIDGTIIAREGDRAPTPDVRFYNDLAATQLSINNFGDYIFGSQLDFERGTSQENDNFILVVNGDVFAREGDTFPAVAPGEIDRFDSAPLRITNSGDVFWYFQARAGKNAAFYMRNQDVIVETGVTQVNGAVVTSISKTSFAFDTSTSGRFWLGDVVLQQEGTTLLLVDFGVVVPVPGCSSNPASLSHSAGDPRLGERIILRMDDAQGPNVVPFLAFSLAPAAPGSPCGVQTQLGELLVDLSAGQRLAVLRGVTFTGNPVSFPIDIPPDPSLIDLAVHAQGAFLDVNRSAPGPSVAMTNGLYLEIGAP